MPASSFCSAAKMYPKDANLRRLAFLFPATEILVSGLPRFTTVYSRAHRLARLVTAHRQTSWQKIKLMPYVATAALGHSSSKSGA